MIILAELCQAQDQLCYGRSDKWKYHLSRVRLRMTQFQGLFQNYFSNMFFVQNKHN